MNITASLEASAQQGVRNSLKAVDQAAEKIAGGARGPAQDPATLTEAVVNLKQAELEGKAALKALETRNDLLGSLLDIRA